MNYIFIAGAVVAILLAIKFSKSKNGSMTLLLSVIGIALAGFFVWNTYFTNPAEKVSQTLVSAETYGVVKLIKDIAPDAKVVFLNWGDESDSYVADLVNGLKSNGIRNLEFISYAEKNPLDPSPNSAAKMFLEATESIQNGDTVYVRELHLPELALQTFFTKNPNSKLILNVQNVNTGFEKFTGVAAQIQRRADIVLTQLPSDPQKAFEAGFKITK